MGMGSRRIRRNSDVPIVFLSAHSDQDQIASAGEIAFSGFIGKPFTEYSVLTVIEKLLGR